jgi:GTP cyclohydrolase II
MARKGHIILTSHHRPGANRIAPLKWGAATAAARGPLVATLTHADQRNVIGTHGGAYSLYRALAISSGRLDPLHVPDYANTEPATRIGPHPQWAEPEKIVALDPWGHLTSEVFAEGRSEGLDIRPSIAVTRARLDIPEIREAIAAGRLTPDGRHLAETGEVAVTKVAIDPVWHLPGIARRFGVGEEELRRNLFEHTAGMFPELITRPDVEVFLPPIGGHSLYIVGEPAALAGGAGPVACRVHDECNGSDVFGSDICTCRPYLMYGLEVCIEAAQAGGAGVVVYNRKEGRALGEVTKFLVYNARKRQAGGDSAATYFVRTECVAGVQDARFQELMPDVLHWLGIRRIDRWVSMSGLKHGALLAQGIEIAERVSIPAALVPDDAGVEIAAKRTAGYFSTDPDLSAEQLAAIKGRGLG